MNIVFMSVDTLPSTLWARDLYDQMHIRSDFRKWFPRMCQYGFIEGRDYEYMPMQQPSADRKPELLPASRRLRQPTPLRRKRKRRCRRSSRRIKPCGSVLVWASCW